MQDYLTIINLILTTATTAFSLGLILIKPFRNWLLGVKKDRQQREEARQDQIETDKCLLRDRILAIYYKRHQDGKIRVYEYEDASYMYQQYKKLGGNSFVDKIWREMQDWEVVD